MIGERLRKLRSERGLTQDEMAKHLGVARSAYTQYESEARGISTDTLRELARFFGVTIDYLVTGEESPHKPIGTPSLADRLRENGIDLYSDETDGLPPDIDPETMANAKRFLIDIMNGEDIEYIKAVYPLTRNGEKISDDEWDILLAFLDVYRLRKR